MSSRRTHTFTRGAGATILAVAVLGLAGCGEEPPAGANTLVGEIQENGDNDALEYDGPFDQRFQKNAASFDGEMVAVSARVAEVVSDHAFTITGNPYIDPLMVVYEEAAPDLEVNQSVTVTGVVHKALDVYTVEDQVNTDVDDVEYEDFEAEPYIEASSIDASAVPLPE